MFKKIVFFTVLVYILVNVMPTFAANQEVSFSLRIAAVGEEEAPSPTPTPTIIPGYAPPGLVVPPYMEEDIFVSGEDGYKPYVRVMIVSGVSVIPDEWFQTMSREPEFLGKTNLQNAILYITFNGAKDRVYTTFANIQGVWKFISPMYLPLGVHTVFITAMSPVNPYFQAKRIFQFEVIPIPPSEPYPSPVFSPSPAPVMQPSPKPSPKHIFIPPISRIPLPRATPSVSPAPIEEKKFEGAYGLNVEVMPDSKNVSGGEELTIKTKIINTAQDKEKDVMVRLIIRDPDGNIVYDKTETYKVKDTLEFTRNMILAPSSRAGKYTVTQEITQDAVTYSTSDYFEVKEQPFVGAKGIISQIQKAKGADVKSIFVMLFFILFFLLLYIREYIQSKKQIPVNDEHFRDEGLIR